MGPAPFSSAAILTMRTRHRCTAKLAADLYEPQHIFCKSAGTYPAEDCKIGNIQMADITLSAQINHPNATQSIGQKVAGFLSRHRWNRFQLEAATLNDRLLADNGIDRGALLSASTEYEFMAQNEDFVPRHDLGCAKTASAVPQTGWRATMSVCQPSRAMRCRNDSPCRR